MRGLNQAETLFDENIEVEGYLVEVKMNDLNFCEQVPLSINDAITYQIKLASISKPVSEPAVRMIAIIWSGRVPLDYPRFRATTRSKADHES